MQSSYNNIIIITALARLIMTNHQIAIALSNFESFSIRLFSVIFIMLSKAEFKTQQNNKRILNFKSDHFSFLLNSNSIINSFARDIRKRFKYINISDQSTFKPKSFILLTAFISSSFISLTTFISLLLNQRAFKSKSFTFFIFINIIRK